MAEDIFDDDNENTDLTESDLDDINEAMVATESDSESEAVSYGENQTSDELSELMDKEGLVAAPEESGQELFVEEGRLKSLIESILFSSPKPMTFDAIKQVFKGTNIKSKHLRRALEDYTRDLADPIRGVYIEEVAGGFQLRTKLDNTEFLKTAVRQKPFRVSGPSMEVLAIVAYKQPCIKAEVDTIRGVESGHLIRVLMDKGLVQFDGKSDLPGKPMLYKTTKKFLEVFGLRNIRELPSLEEIDQLIPEGIGGETEESETLHDLSGKLTLDYETRDQEAEEEFSKITDRLSEITTTSDYFEQEKERQRLARDKDKADDIRERMIMGHLVEEKEINWLKRYEERLLAPPETVSAPPVETITSEDIATDAATEETIEIAVEATLDTKSSEISSENVVHVADKLSGLAGAARDASSLFDDEDASAEDLNSDPKNKMDI